VLRKKTSMVTGLLVAAVAALQLAAVAPAGAATGDWTLARSW
jgi:hypothetical protein